MELVFLISPQIIIISSQTVTLIHSIFDEKHSVKKLQLKSWFLLELH